jgi:hypothetical protein
VAQLDPQLGGACRVEMGGGPTMSGEYLLPRLAAAVTVTEAAS